MGTNANDFAVPPGKRKSSDGFPSPAQLAFGQRLRELRQRRGIFQKDVARDLDVTTAMVSDWERGVVEPSPPYQRDLASYFGVTLEYLWDGNSSTALGGDVLPERLKRVVTSDEWAALPPDVRQGVAMAMARVDLEDFEIRTIIKMLQRGHDAYAERRQRR